MSRDARKDVRRKRQAAAVQKKADEETDFFFSCVRRAQRLPASTPPLSQGGKPQGRQNPVRKPQRSEEAVFGAKAICSGIDFNKYDDIQVECSASDIVALERFADVADALGPEVLRSVERMNYATPTPIQRYSIPSALKGRDLMCSAQTGSGKTASFLIPTIAGMLRSKELMEPSGRRPGEEGVVHPAAVVLAPTRELASQIDVEAAKLCHWTPIVPLCVYGGAPARSQLEALAQAGPHPLLLTATPGRLIDFVDRGIIKLSGVGFLVLDEADRMLDMGFEPQVRQIVQKRDMPPPSKRATLMFSATFPEPIQKLATDFLRPGYTWIAVGVVGSTTSSITQRLLESSMDRNKKMQLLAEQLREIEGRTLVFVRMKRSAHQVKRRLERDFDIKAGEIHGDRSQAQREAALDSFRDGKIAVLIATNVAARGLDIPNVTHVVNFDLPTAEADFPDYVHRVGRTGRAGHRGVATSFYVPGFDPKQGNGKIAPMLLQFLEDADQEIPEWFLALPELKGVGAARARSAAAGPPNPPASAENNSRNGHNNNNNGSNGGSRGGGRGGRGGRGRGRGGRGGSQSQFRDHRRGGGGGRGGHRREAATA